MALAAAAPPADGRARLRPIDACGWLTVLDKAGGSATLSFPVLKGCRYRFGSDESCQIVVKRPFVRPFECSIVGTRNSAHERGGEAILINEHPKKLCALSVNSAPLMIDQVALADGDRLGIAFRVFVYSSRTPEVSPRGLKRRRSVVPRRPRFARNADRPLVGFVFAITGIDGARRAALTSEIERKGGAIATTLAGMRAVEREPILLADEPQCTPKYLLAEILGLLCMRCEAIENLKLLHTETPNECFLPSIRAAGAPVLDMKGARLDLRGMGAREQQWKAVVEAAGGTIFAAGDAQPPDAIVTMLSAGAPELADAGSIPVAFRGEAWIAKCVIDGKMHPFDLCA